MVSVVWAFLGYLLLAIIVTFPLVLSLGTSLGDPVDASLNTWIVAFEHHILLTQPGELLNTNIFYPYKQTLLFSETLLLPSLLMLPIRLATGSAVLVHNVLVLLGFALTGSSGYLLGRWLFHRHWPAMVVGGVLAFNSFTLSNMGQVQLLHLEWLPLALLYVGMLLRKPQIRNALLLAFFLAAQFYTVIYYGIFSFMVIGVVALIGWLLHAYPSPRARLRTGAYLGLGLLVAVALCLPLALRYYALSDTYGFERLLADTWPYSASLETWTTALESNFFYGAWLGRELPTLGFYALDALFPGVILLSLAIVGIALGLGGAVAAARASVGGAGRRFWLWLLFLLVGIFFLLLSFGPYPQLKSLQPNFEVVLPYAWIHEWLPGFQALRAPVRFAALVFLGLALAAAYTVRLVRWRVVSMVLFLLLMAEALSMPATTLYTPTTSEDQRAAYAWLATLPPTAYLEFPVYAFGEEGQEARWLESQLQSMNHWHDTPVGYSGFFPPRYEEFTEFVAQFPRPEVVALLRAMAVEWLVIHRDRVSHEAWQAIEQAVRAHDWQVQQWGDVWAVSLPPNDAESVDHRFFVPDVAQAGATITVGEILVSTTPTPLVPGNELSQFRFEWWRGEERISTVNRVVQPPFFVNHVAVSPLNITTPAQPGAYTLKLMRGDSQQEIASGQVTLVQDIAPPEKTLLPIHGIEAELVCDEGMARADVRMQTIGWYDEAFSLSGRIIGADDAEIARSSADVAFPPDGSRRTLLSDEIYSLPFAWLPESATETLQLEVVAYTWQQAAERIVGRSFVHADGSVTDALRLPLALAPECLP